MFCAAACIPLHGEPLPPVAVALTKTGVDISYLGCRDELTLEVAVQQVESSSGGIVTGPILWRIESQGGVDIDVVRVGQTPQGFKEVVAQSEDLPTDGLLTITVVTTGNEASVDIELSQLQPGQVFVDGVAVDREDADYGRPSC